MRIYDEQEARRLNAEQWQLDLLKLNPSYVKWGPREEYEWKEACERDSMVIHETWGRFGPVLLNDFNECVSFYFSWNEGSKMRAERYGNGTVFLTPSVRVSLTLCILQLRKGRSCAVEISRIEQADLPAIFAWLKTAAGRNAERFSKVVAEIEPSQKERIT